MTRRYTGHPSPRAQTARRVCISAAGYTEGVETLDGPRLFHGRVTTHRDAAPDPVIELPRKRGSLGSCATALLALLGRIRSDMPTLAELGVAIGLREESSYAASRIVKVLDALERHGDIVWWRGHPHGYHGQHAIRIVATGRVLRSPGCPAEVTP